ncbi:cytochrome c family protein [Aestuariivirga litoralis]|uniref:Cytochrome c family protein n=1 Tax=Aestuariivirga litoralis TaxID=2650924 RepID=A0A2W2ATZ4_9HYPH|nr:cytochrome c family protein [Aestuariivirga litoralis]PZF78701.1 cytochrome c family protein [Aestuariivirga litoralis]
MDSFEFNKIAGAVLGTALVVFGLNELSKIIYHAPEPEKQGFAIEVAEAAGSGEAAAATPAAPAESLGAMLASADAAKGQTVFKACAACHDGSKGGPNKVGPNLWGVVGRMHGSHEGFAYSDAMAALKDKPWTYEALNEFITNPKAAIPGTKMAFGGIKKDADRANLLAYLQTLSDSPVPFPAP